jgi:hypothetical protein
MFDKYITVLFGLCMLVCSTACKRHARPLIAKDTGSEAEMANTLFAFVGEKIYVKELPVTEGSMDAAFEARYRVIQSVYGYYREDTITFTGYDHYGEPAFANYKHALLFVSEGEHGWYHEKYQFFDVYLTPGGRWAGTYHKIGYPDENKKGAVKPVPVKFDTAVFYPLDKRQWEDGEAEYYYPEPYYRIDGKKAIPLYGNYIEELFRIKKEGVLAARGLFDDKRRDELDVIDTKLAEIKRPLRKRDRRFITFWKSMATSLREMNSMPLQNKSLDSLLICDSLIAASSFFENCFSKQFDAKLIEHLNDSNAVDFGWGVADLSMLPKSAAQSIVKEKGIYKIWEVSFIYKDKYPNERYFRIRFIETKNGFRLAGCKDYNSQRCCY